jgi:hypothetical protein
MAWDDKAFCARVKARCAELGRSVRSVLIEAGVTLDLLDKTPSAGRRVDTLEKLAAPLQWDLQQVMGFTVSARISADLMTIALKIVRRALRYLPDPEEDEPKALAIAYNTLLDLQKDGKAIDDTVLATLELSIAHNFGLERRKK